MTTAQDPVSVRVKAGLYEFTFALSPNELDEAVARARRCGLTFDAFVRRKMFGPDPERRLGIADDWPLDARLVGWRILLPEGVRSRLQASA
ncbi:hypothetical protein [Minwuia thermotolerans]|uniref:hypothetical protein n=1 Tax=Minwuia thermotolerans TaxID=2056226 RepID=UPI000D6DC46C|nr:hypothetical protein [Minwuia thermotolerans]